LTGFFENRDLSAAYPIVFHQKIFTSDKNTQLKKSKIKYIFQIVRGKIQDNKIDLSP